MAKISRGPQGPGLRDKDGRYTALSFTTREGREFWLSNRAVRTVCGFVTLLIVVGLGLINPSLAEQLPEIFRWALRGTVG